MPMAPPRACRCGQVNCQVHVRQAWQSRAPVQRIRGPRLQAMRARLFDQQPLCVHCLAQGRVTIATIRDHTIPLAEGGPDDETNEQPLCRACSDIKTAAESKRGHERAFG